MQCVLMPALFYRCCTYLSSMNLVWFYLHLHNTCSPCSQCSMFSELCPFGPHTPFRSHQASNESKSFNARMAKQNKALVAKHAQQNKALMATEASERKVLVNACCVVNEHGDIHDNADACIILPLFCGKTARCSLSGSSVFGHWLGL